MNLKYFLNDKITFFRYRFYITIEDLKKTFHRENIDKLKKSINDTISASNLIIILLLLVIIKLFRGFNLIAIIVLIFIIRYYYLELKKGEHIFWERERKGYKINKGDIKK